MENERMDRGTDALRAHLSNTQQMDIRQTRRGWLQECLGCEARSEFRYFIGEQQVAQSLEDADCLCRLCCTPCYPFTAKVEEVNTKAELLTVDRPCACATGSCKCCCYQTMSISSNGQELGSIKETCYFCVPSFFVSNDAGKKIYLVHPPTCCGGVCVNCCTEGNPCCGKGCCKVPFWVFPAEQAGNTDGNVPYVGKILKKPKSLMTEVLTDANAFDVTFPEGSSVEQKALLVGSAIFINALFFEGNDNNS